MARAVARANALYGNAQIAQIITHALHEIQRDELIYEKSGGYIVRGKRLYCSLSERT